MMVLDGPVHRESTGEPLVGPFGHAAQKSIRASSVSDDHSLLSIEDHRQLAMVIAKYWGHHEHEEHHWSLRTEL